MSNIREGDIPDWSIHESHDMYTSTQYVCVMSVVMGDSDMSTSCRVNSPRLYLHVIHSVSHESSMFPFASDNCAVAYSQLRYLRHFIGEIYTIAVPDDVRGIST